MLVGAVAMMAALSYPLFANEIFLEDDISSTYLPLRYFYAECLEAGESFLWIPNIFMGFYLHAEGQNGMSHPLHFALYKFLPFTYALDLEVLLSYPFMFIGAVLFFRRLELRPDAVLFGALLFTFSGYSMSRWLWFVHIGVLAHTPWLLFCIHVAMRSTDRVRVAMASLGVVFFTTSELLVGYPQMVYVTGLVEGLYTLFLFRAAPFRRMIGVLLTAKLLAVLCAAVQILPTFDLVGQSTRAATDYGFRMAGSQHPVNLVQLINPYFFHQRMVGGHGYETMYGGAVMTVFALWMTLRWKRMLAPKPTVLFAAICIVLGTVLTMGHYGYLYRWISELPVISHFRGTPRHWAMFHVGWVLLSVFAYRELSELRARGERIAWKDLAPLFALPILSLALVIFVALLRVAPDRLSALASLEEKIAPTRNVMAGAVLMLLATLVVVGAARGTRYAVAALILFTIADLSVYGLRHKTSGNFDAFTASIDVPPDGPDYRIEPDYHPVYSVNGPLMKGYSTPGGIVSIEPARKLDYFLKPLPLRLAGTRWVRTRLGATEELAAAASEGIEWIELENPMPRARLVANTIVSNDPAADLAKIDIAVTALVEPGVVVEQGAPGEATVLVDRPGRIHVRTKNPSRQLLVLTEAYDDDWRVTVDGEPASPEAAYGDFLAALVEPGEHEVRFRFDPKSYRIGKLVSLAGILAAIALHLSLPRLLPRRAADGS